MAKFSVREFMGRKLKNVVSSVKIGEGFTLKFVGSPDTESCEDYVKLAQRQPDEISASYKGVSVSSVELTTGRKGTLPSIDAETVLRGTMEPTAYERMQEEEAERVRLEEIERQAAIAEQERIAKEAGEQYGKEKANRKAANKAKPDGTSVNPA